MKNKLLVLLFLLISYGLNAKIIYIEPVRDAKYVSINNNIIIGFNEVIRSSDLNSLITITGSKSGVNTGKIILSEDRKKLIFNPDQPFALNEQVEVKINNIKTSNNSNNRLTYTFQTHGEKPVGIKNNTFPGEYDDPINSSVVFRSSAVGPPPLTVTVSNNPTPGNIFLTNLAGALYPSHIVVANNSGTILYSRDMTPGAVDFRRQDNGLFTYNSYLTGKYYAENSGLEIVDSFYCGNGYSTDLHELRLIANGHALLMSYDSQFVDMSQVVPGGDPNAIVIGLIIQEIDADKNVVFQWRSWDHVAITESQFVNYTAPVVDYIHGNAIELDYDGNFLISSRHTNEISKISRATGDFIWRMGGVNNQFTFVNDTIPFHHQHDIRRLPNGNVTLFDNGNFRTPSFSRGVEYSLDEVNKIATLVWEFRTTPDTYGPFMGSVQRLHNGNTLIGWGGSNTNTLTEVTPDGVTALEMKFPSGVWSYRAFRDEANLTLNIKMAIEGFYNSSSGTLNIRDTVTAYLRSTISPYNIIDTARAIVDSLSLTGDFRYFNVTSGNYYITIKHRNGLETWSKAGGETFFQTGVYQYDFTSSDTKAYGDNLTQVGSAFCIYSGDVNQDGSIELADLISVSNDAGDFISGYVNTDVNGDYNTDTFDQIIVYNNAINLVTVIKP